MERTPSPPRRIHTPPAPGTGYEPFSPRRSSRVAAQRDARLHPHLHRDQPVPRTRRDVTPTASSKRSIVRTANVALSPPPSPLSPPTRSPRSRRRADPPPDSDSDHAAPTPARRFLSAMPSVRNARAQTGPASPTTASYCMLTTRTGYVTHPRQDASQARCRRCELHCANLVPTASCHD